MALRDQKVKIPAGQELQLAVNADYLRIKKSAIAVRFRTKNGDDFEIKQGDEVSIKNFEYVYIKNETAGDEVIDLYTGKDERVGSAELSGSVIISAMPANNGAATQGRVSLTNVNQVILAAKATRKYLMIQNNDAGAVMRVRIDGNAATAAQGFRIPAGSTYAFDGFNVTGAINCMMETATGAAGNVEFAEA